MIYFFFVLRVFDVRCLVLTFFGTLFLAVVFAVRFFVVVVFICLFDGISTRNF